MPTINPKKKNLVCALKLGMPCKKESADGSCCGIIGIGDREKSTVPLSSITMEIQGRIQDFLKEEERNGEVRVPLKP